MERPLLPLTKVDQVRYIVLEETHNWLLSNPVRSQERVTTARAGPRTSDACHIISLIPFNSLEFDHDR